jgi:hypothetical protein
MPLKNLSRVVCTSGRYRTVIEEVVEMATTNDVSYEIGPPRNHHSLHFSSGDVVIQVGKPEQKDIYIYMSLLKVGMAIFKIHSLFLMRHSEVLRDMFTVPKGEELNEEADDKPLLLHDKVRGWEVLLSSFYREYVTLRIVVLTNSFL